MAVLQRFVIQVPVWCLDLGSHFDYSIEKGLLWLLWVGCCLVNFKVALTSGWMGFVRGFTERLRSKASATRRRGFDQPTNQPWRNERKSSTWLSEGDALGGGPPKPYLSPTPPNPLQNIQTHPSSLVTSTRTPSLEPPAPVTWNGAYLQSCHSLKGLSRSASALCRIALMLASGGRRSLCAQKKSAKYDHSSEAAFPSHIGKKG